VSGSGVAAAGTMAAAIWSTRAMGTSQHVAVTSPDLLDIAKRAVDRVVRDIDQCCSRFREDSELTRLNATAGAEAKVSPLMARALAAALRAARLSGGAVDLTVGSAVKDSGYDVDFTRVSADGEPIELRARPVPGWRLIRFSEASRRVFVPMGVEIDLGSTAKALASDLAAAAANEAMQSGGVLVSLGGDIAIAGEAPGHGWHVQVADSSETPITPDGETIAITSGGVATSSTTVRRWTRGEVTLHHIIDPQTGLPARGPWRTVTVAAGSCLDANIAATAAIIRGAAAVPWLESLNQTARLVDADGQVVRLGGWPSN
jgi:thiamine biosynthesis lipoprotein ApbE